MTIPTISRTTETFSDTGNMANSSITFYDIASAPPMRPFAPNPSKTR